MTGTAVETLFRRDNAVVLAALVTLVLLFWLALFAGANVDDAKLDILIAQAIEAGADGRRIVA